MSTKTFNAGITLTIDSITETTEVFVEVENCTYDEDTHTAVRKKKSAKAEEDLNDSSDSWISGVVTAVDRDTNNVTVLCNFAEDNEFSMKELNVDVSQLSLKNPSNCEAADDITTMSYLHEAALLENLSLRYDRDIIYTYTGPILIAINPYKRLPDSIYGKETIQMYVGQPLGKLEPHVYAIAEDAFRSMLTDQKNQSILVTGESGAGKTETTKYLLRYFAAMGTQKNDKLKSPAVKSPSNKPSIEAQVLSSTPMLEAFGNAKTLRNDNSSRFGKFIEIQFSKLQGTIEGALIRTYLLEKSRLTRQTTGERNYHIFYQMLAGATQEERETWYLHHQGVQYTADDFTYLNRGECTVIDSVDDAEQFELTKTAMTMIGITSKEQFDTWKLLCAILHLGNVRFEPLRDASQIDESTLTSLSLACTLLGVDQSILINSFLQRRVTVGKESYDVKLTCEQSDNARDSLSMLLYSRLFDWLVSRMNENMSVTTPSGTSSSSSSSKLQTIGILDIYGFESFLNNSLEQFCINWSNEKLQQQYNQHIFKLSQQEYIREKIIWNNIEFNDNQACLDLIEKPPLCIVSLLDEESNFPKANEKTLAGKLHNNFINPKDARLVVPAQYYAKPRFGDTLFTIKHYADPVTYDTSLFLDKNRDYIIPDQLVALENSSFELLKLKLFKSIKSNASNAAQKGNFKFSSVASQFKDSLSQLMDTINATYPHYIRCIKPNPFKREGVFVKRQVLKQLKCGGILESIRITLQGYPTKKLYNEFVQRYKIACPSVQVGSNDQETCKNMLKQMQIGDDMYQFGSTKLFIKAGIIEKIERQRTLQLNDSATRIAKVYRGYVVRTWYKKSRQAAIVAQSLQRGRLARESYKHLQLQVAAPVLQSAARGYIQRKAYQSIVEKVVRIQLTMKAKIIAIKYQNAKVLIGAASIIQARYQGLSQYNRYREQLARSKSIAAIQQQKEELEKEMQRMVELERERQMEIERERQVQLAKQLEIQQKIERDRLEKEQQASDLKSKLTILQDVNVNLESTLQDSKRQVQDLKSELDAQQLKKQSDERTHKQLVESLRNDVKKLESNLTEMSGNLRIQTELRLARDKSIAELERIQSDLNRTVIQSNSELERLREESKRLKNDSEELEKTSTNHKQKLEDSIRKSKTLELELNDSQQVISDLKRESEDRMKRFNSEMQSLRLEFESERNGLSESEQIYKKNRETEIQDLKSKINTLEKTNGNSTKKIQDLEKQLKISNLELQDEKEKVNDSSQRMNEFASTQLEKEERYKVLEQQVRDLERESNRNKTNLEREQKRFEVELERRSNELEELERQLVTSRVSVTELTNSLEETNTRKRESESKVKRFTTELTELREELESLQRSESNKQRLHELDVNELRQRIQELESENQSLTSSRSELERRTQGSLSDQDQSALNDALKKYETERLSRHERDLKLRDLERALVDAQSATERLKSDLDKSKEQANRHRIETEEARREADELARKARLADDRAKEVEELNKRRAELQDSLQKINNEYAGAMDQIEVMTAEMSDLESQLRRVKEVELSALQQKVVELESTSSAANRRKDELEREMKEKNRSHQLVQSDLNEQIADLQGQLELATIDKRTLENRATEFEDELAEVRSSIENAKGDADKNKQDQRALRGQIDELEENLHDMTRARDDLDRRLKAATSTTSELDQRLDDEMDKRQEVDSKLRRLQSEHKDTLEELDIAKRELKELRESGDKARESAGGQLREQLDIAQRELDQLQSMREQLERDIREGSRRERELELQIDELERARDTFKDQLRRREVDAQRADTAVLEKSEEVTLLERKLRDVTSTAQQREAALESTIAIEKSQAQQRETLLQQENAKISELAREEVNRVKEQLDRERNAKRQLEHDRQTANLTIDELQFKLNQDQKQKTQLERNYNERSKQQEERERELLLQIEQLKEMNVSSGNEAYEREQSKLALQKQQATFEREANQYKQKIEELSAQLKQSLASRKEDVAHVKELQTERERNQKLQERMDRIERERAVLRLRKEQELTHDLDKCLHRMQGDEQESAERFIVYLIFETKQEHTNNTVPTPAFLIYHLITYWQKTNREYDRLMTLSINSLRAVLTLYQEDNKTLVYWFSNLAVLLYLFTTEEHLDTVMSFMPDLDLDVEGIRDEMSSMLRNEAYVTFDDVNILDGVAVGSAEENELGALHPFLSFLRHLGTLFVKSMVRLLRNMFQRLSPMLKGGILEGGAQLDVGVSSPQIKTPDLDDLDDEDEHSLHNQPVSPKTIIKCLKAFNKMLQESKVGQSLSVYLVRQVMHFIDCSLFNEILLRKDLCSFAKGMEIKSNASRLDDEVGHMMGQPIPLVYVRQAATLLMMKKNLIQRDEVRRDSIPSLTFPQIFKLLQMFTRSEFEDAITNDTFHFLAKQSNNPANDKTLFLTTKEVKPLEDVDTLCHSEVEGQLHFFSFPVSIRDAIEEKYQGEQRAVEREREAKEQKERMLREQQRASLTVEPVEKKATPASTSVSPARRSFFGSRINK